MLWIKELYGKKIKRVLEIGTGASLVFPILGIRLFGWEFLSTELDPESIENSNKLIKENELEGKAKIVKSNGEMLKGLISTS